MKEVKIKLELTVNQALQLRSACIEANDSMLAASKATDNDFLSEHFERMGIKFAKLAEFLDEEIGNHARYTYDD